MKETEPVLNKSGGETTAQMTQRVIRRTPKLKNVHAKGNKGAGIGTCSCATGRTPASGSFCREPASCLFSPGHHIQEKTASRADCNEGGGTNKK